MTTLGASLGATVIQKLLGHASITHTAHYTKVTPGALRAAVARAIRERRNGDDGVR